MREKKNRVRLHPSRLLLAFGLGCMVIGSFFVQPVFGVLGALLCGGGMMWRGAGWRLKSPLGDRLFLSGAVYIILFSALILAQYFIFPAFTLVSAWFAWLVLWAFAWLVPSKPPCISLGAWRRIDHLWLAIVAFIDVALIGQFLYLRTDAAIVSPWSYVSLATFGLFALGTFLLLRGLLEARGWLWYPVSVLHLFTMLSVAILVYGIGFGFDPFMHRAAEEALVNTGVIEPKTVLYSAQYALVAALHHVTALSVFWIDVLLVPMATAIGLPYIASRSLEVGWGVEVSRARVAWWAVFFIPFMLLTFTVPFSATYSWFICVIIAVPWLVKAPLVRRVCMAMSLLMVFFHPLVSVSVFLILGCMELLLLSKNRLHQWFITVVGVFALTLATPAMMLLYQARQGLERNTLFLFEYIHNFLYLFRSPYTDPYPFIPILLDFIYDLRYILPMLITCMLPLIWWKIGGMQTVRRIYGIVLVGLMGCIFLLSTQFVYEGVIVHEQAEYALRLLQSWYMVPLVLLMGVFARWKGVYTRVGAVLMALLITHAWFFSYPQYNLKFPYLSPSVGAVDVEVVQEIDILAGGDTYAVLTHQMMSAAAIQEFGFRDYIVYREGEHLWYPLPTGGPLYALYTHFLYNELQQETVDDFFQSSNVDQLYFIMHGYWNVGEGQMASYELNAQNRWEAGKHLIIYQFCRYEDCDKDADES